MKLTSANKKRLSLVILFALCAVAAWFMTGCGATPPEDAVAEAEHALESGNPRKATAMCDSIMAAAKDTTALSATTLCRMGMIYASASDTENDETNMVNATNCFLAAGKASPDSVRVFIESLPADRQAAALLLVNLGSQLKNRPAEYPDEHQHESDTLETDSI
ncbi:MAG: hypothetical protein K2M79_03055 [Muribaculaceae bacterium]|nr:hypothetical protein [Muribaculaceae bacterium]